MKVKVLKTNGRLGIKSGEIYNAKGYDDSKITLLSRIPDGFDPECNQYRHEVEMLKSKNEELWD